MTNQEFESAMLALKTATRCLLDKFREVFDKLDDDTAKKFEMNISDVIYSLSRANEDVDMLEWCVKNDYVI